MKEKKIALYGMLVAVSLILSYVETLVPLHLAVPGVKIGLPNIAILFALYQMGFRDACIISLVRILLSALLFGNVMTLAYSAGGALVSLGVMYLLKKSGKFGVTGVSVAGGVAHNFGQMAVAALVLRTQGLLYYLPVLCIAGTVAGICVGLVSAILMKRVKR